MVDTAPLRSRLARGVVAYVENAVDHPYATVLHAAHDQGQDIIDLNLEIALAQDRRVAIRPNEPIRLIFPRADDTLAPRILAIRHDFPIGEVHTNLDREDDGLGLCVWEESWEDLSRTLTGQTLVERIRWWLAGMADGSLHPEGQALEPLIASVADTIVFPPGSLMGPWTIGGAHDHGGRWTMTMTRDVAPAGRLLFDVFYQVLPPQVHGALAARPYDLGGLCVLADRLGFDLMAALRTWLTAPERLADATKRRALFLLLVPKQRSAGATEETLEPWVYTPSETLAVLGEKLGLTMTYEEAGQPVTGAILGQTDAAAAAGAIKLFGWRIVQRLDRAAARRFAGVPRRADARLVAIGAGAIGSNVIMNVTHAGLGTWTIVDNDVLLPHNTVRQTQSDWGIGLAKASLLANDADAVLAESGNRAIVADILHPGEEEQAIKDALLGADLVVDFSASPSVVGHLADAEMRRASSFFFSPDGADLVVLDEGADRSVRIDEVEAQYFLAVAAQPALAGHLAAARTDRIRYANACQDLSRPLPPWQVQTLSGLAASELPQLLERAEPSASVWRLDTGTRGISPITLPIHATIRFDGNFRVTISRAVLAAMQHYRACALPNETGGILIGTYDLIRRIVHIVAALSAPADSRQSPTYFVRGSSDLEPLVDRLASVTAGRLHYVGEWHSHPNGAAARPSDDDEGVFAYLNRNLGPAGSPHAMMICGDHETWLRAGWQGSPVVEGTIAHAA